MKIIKSGTSGGAVNTEEELQALNAFAKTELSPEDVYIFSVLLCDNDIDRDFECFSPETLKELSELFVGATGICDHEWKSENQVARIYRTELVCDTERKTKNGEPYMFLKGFAYMLKTEGNAELIREIDGGIKRETSIGCAVAKSICSICGEAISSCTHEKGREYGGKLCYASLEGAVDAYEWSFVAVPAQRNAGVMKGMSAEALEKEASLGRRYMGELKKEVLRLCLTVDEKLYSALEKSVEFMDAEALVSMKDALNKRAEELFIPVTQLPGKNEVTDFIGDEYRI